MSTRAAVPDMRTMLATIAREANRRGLVLTASDRFVTDADGRLAPDGDALVARLEAAWAATDGDKARHAHVAQMTAAIAHNAADRSGPVTVSRTAWLLIKSYALTGAPPPRET